ncbi:MAG: hypothetical protein PHR44_01335 [Candidatus Omnitrophica bacterium]|nr:hypothetical protein [Candidatus Omnitrophota bacterium]
MAIHSDLKEASRRWARFFKEGVKDERIKKHLAFSMLLIFLAIFLILRLFFLSYKIKMIAEDKAAVAASISKDYRDIDEAALADMQKKTGLMWQRLLGLTEMFDPAQEGRKEGYEASLYFVEQLQSIEKSLKLKAENKKLLFQGLGFNEDLPSEKDSVFYLKQMDALRSAVELGLDSNISFGPVMPQGIDQKDESLGFLRLLARAEFTAAPSDLVEYINEIRDTAPLLVITSLKAEEKDGRMQASMLFERLHCGQDWRDRKLEKPLSRAEAVEKADDYLKILRGVNPFFQDQKKEEPAAPAGAAGGAELKKERLIFKGSAVFRDRPVAVIEDTLSKETFFIAEGQSIATFKLLSFSSDSATLTAIDSGKEIVLQRGK